VKSDFPGVVVGLLGDKVDIEFDDGDKGGVRHGEGGVEIGEVSVADQCSFGCELERGEWRETWEQNNGTSNASVLFLP